MEENFENDILGFDPANLKTYQETQTSTGNPNIYKTKPSDSKDDDGHYRCKIKVIYNPYDLPNSIIEQQGYSMQDKDGYFYVVSKLTNNDTSCPIFKAWKRSHFAKKDENPELWKIAAKREEGGKQMFDKRFARYVTVQIIEDKNQTDLQGQYMFWKLPRMVWEAINKKQHPAAADNKIPVQVMDFLFGCVINIDVKPGPKDPKNPEREQREISYSCEIGNKPVSCTNPDGTPLLNDEQTKVLDAYVEKLRKIWDEDNYDKAVTLNNELKTSDEAKALRPVYKEVLEKIKTFCPNVSEEMGYKEWSEETTNRVNNWINIVMSGNDPGTYGSAPEAAVTAGNVTDKQEPSVSQASVGTEDEPTDDLPF